MEQQDTINKEDGNHYEWKYLTPNIALLIGPLYLIWTLTVEVRATMQDTSTARTSPTSRFFCTTRKDKGEKEHIRYDWYNTQLKTPTQT